MNGFLYFLNAPRPNKIALRVAPSGRIFPFSNTCKKISQTAGYSQNIEF